MSIVIHGIEMPIPGQVILIEIDSEGRVYAAYDAGNRSELIQYRAETFNDPETKHK